MNTEFEAKFIHINKTNFRAQLKKIGAKLIKPEFFQRRVAFNLPKKSVKTGYIRVRDEREKITMSLKFVKGKKISDQKEIMLEVNSFKGAIEFLNSIGCNQKAFQETKRELWRIADVDITIDEWPFLEPFVEIEGNSENKVKSVCKKLGLDYSKAIFGAVDTLYHLKYGVAKNIINNHTPVIEFKTKNPFITKRV